MLSLNKSQSKRNPIVMLLLIVAIMSVARLIPHPWNLTPVGAIMLGAAAYVKPKWLALAAPLFGYWMSDIIVMNTLYQSTSSGFQWFGSISVFISFFVMIIISMSIFRRFSRRQFFKHSIWIAMMSALLFFVISNTGAWLWNPIYPKTVAGWSTAISAGRPFFQNTMASYVSYSIIVFGGMHILEFGIKGVVKPVISTDRSH